MSVEELQKENNELKEKLQKLETNWENKIDKFVDNWFEKNKDTVDIGRISVFEIMGQKFEIDVLPDEMEKAIYKKCFKIAFSLLKEL